MGKIAKLEMGIWQCKDLTLTAAPSTDPTAASDGKKPHCPKSKLPKLEHGVWMCKDAEITSKPNDNALLLPAVQKVREAAAR